MNNQETINWNESKNLQLLKDTICKGGTDNEFQLFLHVCKRTGLDPFAKQIFPVSRWDEGLRRKVMTIQIGIDGYRLIAERSGNYSPGRAPVYKYDKEGKLVSSTAFVKKRTSDGSWHEIEAQAFYKEYCAIKKDGFPTHMWETKPHVMLSKCAESNALRRSFPAELSGTYTQEEMQQAENPAVIEDVPIDINEKIVEIQILLEEASVNSSDVMQYLEQFSEKTSLSLFDMAKSALENKEVFVPHYKEWISEKEKGS